MLKDLVKGKQLFYRQHYHFPNKVILNEAAFLELKAELKNDLKTTTLMPPQVNGLALFIAKEQKEPFIISYDETLGPNTRDMLNATDDQ